MEVRTRANRLFTKTIEINKIVSWLKLTPVLISKIRIETTFITKQRKIEKKIPLDDDSLIIFESMEKLEIEKSEELHNFLYKIISNCESNIMLIWNRPFAFPLLRSTCPNIPQNETWIPLVYISNSWTRWCVQTTECGINIVNIDRYPFSIRIHVLINPSPPHTLRPFSVFTRCLGR